MVYKIVLSIGDCNNFTDLYNRLSELGDIIYIPDDTFYIYLSLFSNFDKNSLLSVLKSCEIEQFIIKNIDVSNENDMNFVNVWINEHIQQDNLKKIETEHQKELKKMFKNIDKANKLLT